MKFVPVLLACIFHLTFRGVAQIPVFDTYDETSGLISNYVMSTFQDKQGFIWFCTDKGLSRYDGREFVNFGTSDGLPSPFVLFGSDSGTGKIWFSLFEKELAWFENNRFHSLPDSLNQVKGIGYSLFHDAYGRLFAFGQNGFSYSSDSEYRFFPSDYITTADFDSLNQTTIAFVNNSLIRIQSFRDSVSIKPLTLLVPDSSRIANFNPYNFSIGLIKPSTWLLNSNFNHAAIMRLQNDTLYFEQNSIRYVGRWTTQQLDSTVYYTNKNLGFRSASIYSKNEMNFDLNDGLAGEHINHVYRDKEENLWISFLGNGVQKMRQQRIKPFESVTGTVSVIIQASPTSYIFATSKGMFSSQSSPYRFTGLISNARPEHYFKSIRHVFIQPHTTRFFIGTFNSLLANLTGDEVQQLNNDFFWNRYETRNLPHFHVHVPGGVSGIIEDETGTMWISTYGTGIGKLNEKNEWQEVFTIDNGLPTNQIEDLLFVNKHIWARTLGYGLIQINPKTQQLSVLDATNGLISNELVGFGWLNDSTLWVSSNRGYTLMNPDFTVLQHMDGTTGLLREKHLLLFETPRQQLFSVSQSGLSVFKDSLFIHLGSVEILQKKQSSITKAHYNAVTHELIIGSTLGAHAIDMNSVKQQTRVPNLVLKNAIADSTKLQVDAPNKIPYSPTFVQISVSGLTFYDEKESVFRFNLTRNGAPSWSPIQKNAEVQYSQLSFGSYTVTGKMRQADGIWSEETTLVSFEILPPWYFSSVFIGFITVFSLGIITFSVRYITRRKYEKLLIELEKRELLNRERSRIARDLHDEIGANLTQIALLSELVQKQLSQQNNDASPLKKVVEAAKSGVSNLSEIVWSLNPKHDSLENTVTYIQEFSENYFKHHQIQILFDIQTNLPNVSLSSDIRHSLLMCVKEVLNNAMKYSEAKTIWIHVFTSDATLIVIIQDNGKGFVLEDKLHTGNGLGNLFSRMSRYGGDCSIETAPGKGCQVRIQLPI